MLKYAYLAIHSVTGRRERRQVVAVNATGFLRALTKWNRTYDKGWMFIPLDEVPISQWSEEPHPDTL